MKECFLSKILSINVVLGWPKRIINSHEKFSSRVIYRSINKWEMTKTKKISQFLTGNMTALKGVRIKKG